LIGEIAYFSVLGYVRRIVMRTTLVLDADTLPELMELTGAKSRSQAVRRALEEYIRIKRTEELLSLRGRFDIEDSWRELRELDTLPLGEEWDRQDAEGAEKK
jgi:Arc/MetJ family transcription regulator